MTGWLTPWSPARIVPRATPIETIGAVYAYFSLESTDTFRGIATYVLHVSNRTDSALLCRAWVLSRRGEPIETHSQPIAIAAHTDHTARLPLRLRDLPAFDRAMAEVVGANVRCIVEAPAPSARTSRRLGPVARACLAAGLLIGASVLTMQATAPRIASLALPPETLSGTTVEAQYAVSGMGSLSYVVTAPDGRRLQGGPLHDRSGEIFIGIPSANAAGAYTLRMAMINLLGSVSETRVLNAVPGIGNIASVDRISVNPTVAAPGKSIDVSYDARGTSGYVRLIGDDGTIWGQQSFSRNGEASFVVPSVPNAREMRVIVHTDEGTTSAQSMAGIVVTGGSSAALPVKVAADPNPAVAPDDEENGTFQLVKDTVRSGDPISVRVITPHNDMRISLNDLQSHEIRGVAASVEPDGIVTIPAPTVSVPTRYTIVATFSDAFGQETVVEPLTVIPNSSP